MSLHRAIPALAIAVVAIAACGDDLARAPTAQGPRPTVFGGIRPVTLQAPPDPLEPGKLYPLVLLLHAYGGGAASEQAYLGMADVALQRQALVLAPDGLIDSKGSPFWNADANWDFDHANPDDVGYLGGLVDAVMRTWPVDPQHVMVIGHSNGGVMAYRLACDRADVFTGAVAIASKTAQVVCSPAQAIHILHLHGSADPFIPYSEDAVDEWAIRNGCTGTRAPGPDFDLDSALAGAETHTFTTSGCPAGSSVELWKIEGAVHFPTFAEEAIEPALWTWFTDHAR